MSEQQQAPPAYTVSQIEHTVDYVGRQKAQSKRRIRWVFSVTPTSGPSQGHPTQHELVFTWSVNSGKQDITLDGTNLSFNRQKGRSVFNEKVNRMGVKPDLRIVCTTTIPTGSPVDFVLYELLIDDMPYRCHPVAPNGKGRQEVYLGGSIGGMRPPTSILDITDEGRFDGAGSPDYVPGRGSESTASAILAAGVGMKESDSMDISSAGNEHHRVGFRTDAAGDDLAKHEYEKHRHFPEADTHYPEGKRRHLEEPQPQPQPPAESMDLLSFDVAPAAEAAPAAAAAAPDLMAMDTSTGGELVPTEQPASPYGNDLLGFGTAPAAAAAPPAASVEPAQNPVIGTEGHISFSSLTAGDDINQHEFSQHKHYPEADAKFPGTAGAPPAKPVDPHVGFRAQSDDSLSRHDYEQHQQHYPQAKTHYPGTEGAPPAKPVDPHVGFRTQSDDSLSRHDYEQHQHGIYPKGLWVAPVPEDGEDGDVEAPAAEGAAPAAAAPAAGINPFDQFAAAAPGVPPQGGQQQPQQPPTAPGESNDLLNF